MVSGRGSVGLPLGVCGCSKRIESVTLPAKDCLPEEMIVLCPSWWIELALDMVNSVKRDSRFLVGMIYDYQLSESW